MGFWDRVLSRQPWTMAMTPRVEYIGGSEALAAYYGADRDFGSPDSLWRTQPHLRTVVDFVARNVAQLGLHVFERVGDTDRRRDRESLVSRTLAYPDGSMTTYDLIYALIGDILLYDRAYWLVGTSSETLSGHQIRRIPPSWVTPGKSDPFRVKSWLISFRDGDQVEVDASQIVAFTGYSPVSATSGSPTIEALRDTLREQVEAARYRQQVWKRGGRVSSVLERPKDAGKWSSEARDRFREDWYSKFTGRGSGAGGTPILEDGMTLKRIDFSAQESQFVEAAKLSMTTVAAAFHVNPTMIGQNDGANYSNVREFRKMLYGDTLGPTIAQVEARLNTFLLPMLQTDPVKFYCEFNIDEKLQGNFEEQSQAYSTAAGAPWMTRNEVRARQNLPRVDGGDDLVTPLNVLLGGQASPADSGSQNVVAETEQPKQADPVAIKARPQGWDRKHAEVFRKFFKRQRSVVMSRLGGKADWWDEDRWNRELADDLYKLGVAVSRQAARDALKAMGVDPETYDVDRTLAYLKVKARGSAERINAKTRDALEAAIDDEDADPADVFDLAESSRSEMLAVATVTSLSGFGTCEAGRQSGAATKTWITGPNPRDAHAAMDGETVGLDENFSNGLAWPGDAAGSADDLANCNCSLSFSYEE